MKKLEKLKLHVIEEIGLDDQKFLKGGGEWVIGPDGNQYWFVGEVSIIGKDPCTVPEPCPACELYHTANNHQPSMGVQDENPALSGWSDLFFCTIPHLLELWGHVDTTEDTYSYTLAGSN